MSPRRETKIPCFRCQPTIRSNTTINVTAPHYRTKRMEKIVKEGTDRTVTRISVSKTVRSPPNLSQVKERHRGVGASITY